MHTQVGLGQDSHRFLPKESTKPCIIGGVIIEETPGFKANSDGDIVFHALCNAITSLTGELILGGVADELLEKEGITDSAIYLEKALETLGSLSIVHIAFSLEALRPKLKPYLFPIRESVAKACHISPSQVGITATTGEGLTQFGCGEGAQCLCILTVTSQNTQSTK